MTDTISFQDEPMYPFKAISDLIRRKRLTMEESVGLRAKVLEWVDFHVTGGWEAYSKGIRRDFMQFVNYRLSDTQKQEAIDKYISSTDNVLEMAARVIVQDYKLTSSYSADNRCFIVSLIGRTEGHPNFGMCMTTRHGDYETALAYLCYKELDMFAGTQWSEPNNEQDWG